MINPYDLDHPWDRNRLEEWILFSICVCNKPADPTAVKVEKFLYDNAAVPKELSPFERVTWFKKHGQLRSRLEKMRFGQYTRIEKAMLDAVEKIKDPLNTSVAELESVHGIGPKSARMIMLYYKPETLCAPLDTHVLKWLRAIGVDAPVGTPSGKRYLELEKIFLDEAYKRGMTPKQLDTAIWQSYALPPEIPRIDHFSNTTRLKPGQPCGKHPGCLSHISHPCEGCGRIGGFYPEELYVIYPELRAGD